MANGKYSYYVCSHTNNREDYDDFDPGESYLELSNSEEAMIEKVCSEFDDVVVVINANNVSDLQAALTEKDPAYQGVASFVNYAEGIYVGYRFYETEAEEGLINYEDQVLYSFGYGLSYTDFTQQMEKFSDNGDTVSFDVKVTNIGDVAGKDVVEVYCSGKLTLSVHYSGGSGLLNDVRT